MTLQDQITACKAEIEAAAPRIVETMAQTQLALVTLRIQSQGLRGAYYTGKLVSRSLFASKAFNAGGRAYAKQKGKGSYSGFKSALGLKSDVVTLTFTGRMFRSLTTIYAGVSGTLYLARIVASDQESADKVQYNTDRYGDFLRPEADEAAAISDYAQGELARIVNRFFTSA